ncbi:MAG: hypothetical protein ACC662_04800, partial [Planctomycetota bacterium]
MRARFLPLPLLLLLPAPALIAWIVWPGPAPAPEDDMRVAPPSAEAPTSPLPPREEAPAAQPALDGTGSAADVEAGRRTKPKWPVVPSDRIPRGGLDVLVLGPDERPYAGSEISVRLVRLGAAFWAPPLPVVDPDTQVHAFRNVPFGKVRVRVLGDHVVETTREAEVPNGGIGEVEVFADRAGAVHYRASLPDGSQPARVTLALRSTPTRKPVEARFQT